MNKLYTSRLREFHNKRKNKTTQFNFAEELNISPEFYSQIENGIYNPSILVHTLICTSLDKTSDCFFNVNHPDIHLTKEQYEYLNTLDTDRLFKILDIIKTLSNSNQEQNNNE